MSRKIDEDYMNTRIALDDAMAEYIKAAQAMGTGNEEIEGDVIDSLFDASGGDINIRD